MCMAGEVTVYVSYVVSLLWRCTQRIYEENQANIPTETVFAYF